jgi:hypothetical protein
MTPAAASAGRQRSAWALSGNMTCVLSCPLSALDQTPMIDSRVMVKPTADPQKNSPISIYPPRGRGGDARRELAVLVALSGVGPLETEVQTAMGGRVNCRWFLSTATTLICSASLAVERPPGFFLAPS